MELIRISVANLCRFVITPSRTHGFGVLNPKKLARRERFVQALGGGANLTRLGKETLEKRFGASDFEFDSHSGLYDARFQVPAEHVESVFRFLEERDNQYIETEIMRELRGELLEEEYSGLGPIFQTGTTMPRVRFVTSLRQPVPSDGVGTSERAKENMPTHRLFFLWDLKLSTATAESFFNSKAVVLLTRDELLTTARGQKKGMTKDKIPIADNLGVGLDID